jgi:SAM-dependent methyltransferase
MNPARAYRALYQALCGVHPDLRPWHSQWLAGSIVYQELRSALAQVGGDVLDVGCGSKPYERWVSGARRYVGVDVAAGPTVDALIEPGRSWPLEDSSFDTVLCTQVLEHAADVEHTLAEIARVLRPGGALIVTAPFIYNQHDAHDYRRFSVRGLSHLLAPRFEIVDVTAQGGVGSSLGILLLNWIELSMTSSRSRLAAFMALLPAWLALCAAVNACGWALDRIDGTGACYGNVLVRARKPAASTASA